jgi:hypothetical protein
MSAPSSKANSGTGEVKTYKKIRIRRPGRHRKKARKQDQPKQHFA